MKKILIIRFSSFGDIIQCMSVVGGIKKKFPAAEIHWAVRSDFAEILSINPLIDKVWSLERGTGLPGLVELGLKLKKEKFDLIYDAHSNLRSGLLGLFIRPMFTGRFIRRSKERLKRFFLFSLKKNFYEWPYRGMLSYQKPLWRTGIHDFDYKINWRIPQKEILPETIVLVPAAAWPMKTWPLSHWKKLVELLPERRFVVLGGPHDYFCEEIRLVAPLRVENLAGRLSLLESCAVVKSSSSVVSADTGLLHVADLFGVKTIALIGPTAFGFPTGKNVKTLEVVMPCRPCTKDGRGKCSQDVYQKCMVDILPEMVAREL